MIGDLNDMLARLKAQFPASWFQTSATVDATLQGPASALATSYSQIQYAKLQTRILTATDSILDLIAYDFFGTSVARKTGQSDDSFRATIIINLLRERDTRYAIIKVLTDLTGRAPTVFEPQRPLDTGAYGAPNSGYGAAGGYGSLLLPFQAFVTAYRPVATGIQYVAGYGSSPGGYGTASQANYETISRVADAVTDADLYAAIDSVRPAGSTVWTQINP